jgi:hypothetical protein
MLGGGAAWKVRRWAVRLRQFAPGWQLYDTAPACKQPPQVRGGAVVPAEPVCCC